ncbi:hypothetical protein ABLE68_13665 [Nocardioides sp. CN2-186]|uniref:hypothetical protein n=1 Tax=Nocardioides tweenelious TaxID=3156607 RepID=UPI0032B5CB90
MMGYDDNLRAFDSHERGILLQWIAGQDFILSDEVRRTIGAAIERVIPEAPFVAMDYTLDWLYAAVRTTHEGTEIATRRPWPGGKQLTASPEDIDLLIAWEDKDGPHTILVEAKGFTGWSNSQMTSKAARLAAIFPSDLAISFDVHFVLAGPKRSPGLSTEGWPAWMSQNNRVHFVNIPDPGTRYSVQRCDSDGRPTKSNVTHWQPWARKWPQSL